MKYKHIMIIFGVTAALSLYFRMKQQLTTIDEKGFIIQGLTSTNFFLVLRLICFFVIAVTAAFFTRRCPMKPPKVNLPLCVSAAVLGGWMIYESATIISPISVPAWQSTLMAVLGVASGIIFIVYAATHFKDFSFPKEVFIVPILFWMIRLIWIFTALNTLALTIEHVLLLLNCSAILLFMLQFAKLMNSLERSKNYKKIQVLGVASIILCADYAIPNLMLEFMGNRTPSKEGVSSEILILLTSVFILIFMLSYFNETNLKQRHRRKHRRTVNHPGEGKDSFYIGGSR